MITERYIGVRKMVRWNGKHFVWLSAFVGAVAALYHYDLLRIQIPWLPTSIIGTAVAFYVGFKNSQAYDRMWEARKIWGSIVNDSRTWGMMVNTFVSNYNNRTNKEENNLTQIKKRLIYRHIAWLYVHRSQLLLPTSWEHISQSGHTARNAKYYQKNFGIGLIKEETDNIDLKNFLSDSENNRVAEVQSPASSIIYEQFKDLAGLRELGLVDDFRHMEMTGVLRSFSDYQGRNERIKKFPLPRQYANSSRYFIAIFIFMLPFSMIPELMKIDSMGFWLSIPVTVIIGWVYVLMEMVGDYSENPFQGFVNDVPMMSLCRMIEIDLREILGENDLPSAIKSKDGVLM